MPITPIDSITYANQNMNVASTKQNEHQNRIEKQAYAAVEELAKKENTVSDINELTEDKAIDPEKEHNKEQAEKESGEKNKEIKQELNKNDKKEVKEEFDTTYHILNIKV
jgi:hypothetical protein